MKRKVITAVYDDTLFIDAKDLSKVDANNIREKAEKQLGRKLALCIKPRTQWLIPEIQNTLVNEILKHRT